MTFAIMGPQGCGKGTQAKLIAKEFNLIHVSVGDILRDEIKSGSALGESIAKCINQGNLVPGSYIKEIMNNILKDHDDVVLDGFPRNLDQADFLVNNFNLRGVVVITLSEEESVRRISKRVICSANNKIFSEDVVTEEDRAECAALGGEIVKRADDMPEAVLARLKIYRESTAPCLALFKKHGVPVIFFDGNKSIEDLFNDIKTNARDFFS